MERCGMRHPPLYCMQHENKNERPDLLNVMVLLKCGILKKTCPQQTIKRRTRQRKGALYAVKSRQGHTFLSLRGETRHRTKSFRNIALILSMGQWFSSARLGRHGIKFTPKALSQWRTLEARTRSRQMETNCLLTTGSLSMFPGAIQLFEGLCEWELSGRPFFAVGRCLASIVFWISFGVSHTESNCYVWGSLTACWAWTFLK